MIWRGKILRAAGNLWRSCRERPNFSIQEVPAQEAPVHRGHLIIIIR